MFLSDFNQAVLSRSGLTGRSLIAVKGHGTGGGGGGERLGTNVSRKISLYPPEKNYFNRNTWVVYSTRTTTAGALYWVHLFILKTFSSFFLLNWVLSVIMGFTKL